MLWTLRATTAAFVAVLWAGGAVGFGLPDPTPAASVPTPESPAVEPPSESPKPSWQKIWNPQPTFLANVAVNHTDGNYQVDDLLSVEFRAEQAAHLYLLYHQSNGTSVLIFPNPAQKQSLVAAKETARVPARGEKFRLRIRPPLGDETLQTIASLKPVEMLEKLAIAPDRAIPSPATTFEQLAAELLKHPDQWAEHRTPIRTREAKPAEPVRPAARAALIITVDDYEDPESCPPMEVIRHSGERMGESLLKFGGIDRDHLRWLSGKAATRRNIEQAIVDWLPGVTAPGDTVIIFYCGHGASIPNSDGSEPDGHDELISTYDNRVERGQDLADQLQKFRAKWILDDTLARWLQQLSGRRTILLLETCHVGGLVDTPDPLRQFKQQVERVKDISQLNMTVITGSFPEEVVAANVADIKRGSFMPQLIIEAMEKLPRPVTIRQAYEYYLNRVPRLQKPKLPTGTVEVRPQTPTITDTSLIPIILAP